MAPFLRNERCIQILDVGLCSVRVLHADGCVASRCLAARTNGVAENPLGQVGKVHEVLVDESVPGTAEPSKTVFDIGRVARLRHLPIIDNVDAKLDLLAYDVRHGAADAGGKRRAVDRYTFFLCVHDPHEVVGPRQAPGVRGQKSFCAADHAAMGARRADERKGYPPTSPTEVRRVTPHVGYAALYG